MDLSGSVALITGAAGAGIGQATARCFALAGATVVVTDIHQRRMTETVEKLSAETTAHVTGFRLDCADRAQIASVVSSVREEFGSIDILVNNAAVNSFQPIDSTTDVDWDATINTDLTGPFLLIRAVAPIMKAERKGTIINISSIAAYTSPALEVGYAAAKAGLQSITRTAARELGPFGIRCNAIAPGLVWTRFLAKYEDQFKDEIARTPLQRWGQPEDIANAALFLASERSSYITGEVITVSGGWYMHP